MRQHITDGLIQETNGVTGKLAGIIESLRNNGDSKKLERALAFAENAEQELTKMRDVLQGPDDEADAPPAGKKPKK